jgi:SAM-dependent methyltransferase
MRIVTNRRFFGRESASVAYSLDQAGDPAERERLALLQRLYDPKTIPHFERLGVAAGWHCQDIGAGAGSIAQWLGQRVGPTGSVLAVDLDLTLLQPLASSTLSVRRIDIRSEELPGNADLVHARLLLEHLPNPEGVLQRFIRALRPGGWLVVTDTDFRTVHFRETSSAFDRVLLAFAAATRAAGWNMQLGPELPSMLEKAGLGSVGAECWQRFERPGVAGLLLMMTFRRFRDRLVDQGANASDVDDLIKKVRDGTVGVFGPTSWSAWGQRGSG